MSASARNAYGPSASDNGFPSTSVITMTLSPSFVLNTPPCKEWDVTVASLRHNYGTAEVMSLLFLEIRCAKHIAQQHPLPLDLRCFLLPSSFNTTLFGKLGLWGRSASQSSLCW